MAILTNKKWQAYEDAETLARYQDIMDDPKRKRAAILEAKNKAKDLNKRASLMQRAAGGKITTKNKKEYGYKLGKY